MIDPINIIQEHPEFEAERERAEQAENEVEELKDKLEDKQAYIDDSESSLEKELELYSEISDKKLTLSEAINKIKSYGHPIYGMPKEFGSLESVGNMLENIKPEVEEVKVVEIKEVEVEVLPRGFKETIDEIINLLNKLVK